MELPLIGRDAELRELQSALEEAAPAVLLVGDTGTGKTRLAAEWVASAEDHGTAVQWVAATRASSTIPFGAFAHLLAADAPPAADRLQLLLRLRAALQPAPGARLVVAVDDAHLLDQGSAALVHQLADAEGVLVLLTVRAGEPVPDSVTALWKDSGGRRIDLGALDRAAVGSLVEHGLDGPASASLLNRLWDLSQGYPLFLAELLGGGMERGAFVRGDDGMWHARGSFMPSGRLTEIVAQRVSRLPVAAARAIEYLAFAGALEISVLERLTDPDAVESLEAAHLLTRVDDGARRHVRLTHPIHGEVVGAELHRTRAQQINQELATAIEALGMKRRTDLLRVATLALEGGLARDAALLTAAASEALARFDHRLAERLARAALNRDGDTEARLLLGEALRCQNRFDEADKELRRVERAAETEAVVARCALSRAQTLFYGLRRPLEGVGVIEAARARISDPGWRADLDAQIALLATFLGDMRSAADTGARVLAEPGAPPHTVVNTLVVSTIAQVMLGRFDETSRQIAHGLQLAAALEEPMPMAEELLHANSAYLDGFAGRLPAAEQQYRPHLRQAVEAGVDDLVGLWGGVMSQMLSLRGQVAEAIEANGQALAALRRSDSLGLLAITTAFHAMNLAQADDADGARSLLAAGTLKEAQVETRTRLHHDRALVWLAVAEGRVQDAAKAAQEAGLRALDDALVSWAMLVLHDAVRLGYPALVVDPLRESADTVDGELLPLLARHAEALASSDAQELDEVAGSFERLGCDRYAAEAAAHAAVVHTRDGAPRAAKRSSARAGRLQARCPYPRTRALAGWSPRLTRREREVASLAARGLTSPQIAQRLVVSSRTVDNHLASVYRKLGLHGRHELTAALAPPEHEQTGR